ncbi:hypothetical protein DPMN_029978 [Dreissena polymorpha]|uniref:Uncharacterized protein n=1 Tax=Dreissena polymorpha TaxID=45954 RepID=A0A9D4LXD3_DREPO|nr:hypothetical protein DPMN_029978 [Dreissena polymorpha]
MFDRDSALDYSNAYQYNFWEWAWGMVWLSDRKTQNIIGTNLLTKFHEDRKINVAFRVLTRKNVRPPGSHVFQPTGIIFELVQDIIEMNLLTKFHEDRTVNVASKRKMPRPMEAIFFKANIIILELIQDTIETNLLAKFHEDWTINVASRMLTRFYNSHIKPYKEKCPATGGHVFKATKTIFELIQDIIGTNLLTKFHDDRKINPRPRGGIVFQPTGIIFQLVHDNIGMNLLTVFHEDRTINVASRVKNAPPFGSHVFQANVTIYELIKDIMKTNLLTIFHQDWTINVAFRVLTRKNAPPHGGHVFQPTSIIFELVQDIIGMNLLTKFHKVWTINVASRVKNAPPHGSHVFQAKLHEDRKINVASREKCPAPGDHVFQPTGIIFELVQDIIGMNLLTKFYEDQTINVASRVLTRFYYSHIRKSDPPLGSHVFQANVTIFELIQDIIETNLLTKFYEDWTINVAYRELTSQMLTPYNARRTTDKRRSQKLTMSTFCSGKTNTILMLGPVSRVQNYGPGSDRAD